MSSTLLTYAVQTSPDPLQVSPQKGQPSLATLTIVVSNDTRKLINCQSISFGFLQGAYAKDFFSDATGIGTSPPTGWSIAQDGALFTATPGTSDAGQVGAEALTFVLSNIKVNQEPGTTDLNITEVTASGTGTLSYPLAKFPPQFEVSDLKVMPPPPIASGGSVTLSWSGTSGATYQIQYEDADGNIITILHPKGEPGEPLPPAGSYTIENLQVDTTFYLIVTVKVEGQDSPLVVEKFFPVAVQHLELKPEITLFEGRAEFVSSTWQLILNWDTSNADYCLITGDANRLATSSTGDAYKVALTPNSSVGATYQLTAKNSVGQDTSQVTLEWQPQPLGSAQIEGNNVAGIACSPDGTSIYIAYPYVMNSGSGYLSILDAQTLQTIGSPVQVGNTPGVVAVSPDGTRIYVVSLNDGSLSVIDSATLQVTASQWDVWPNGCASVAASHDGTQVYVTSKTYNSITVLDAQTLQQSGGPSATLDGFGSSISVSPDGTHVYLVVSSNRVLCLDARTLHTIGSPVDVGSTSANLTLAVSADGARLYVADSSDSTLSTLDASSLEPVGSPVALQAAPTAVGVSVFNSNVYVTGDSGMLYIFSPLNVSGGKTSA